MILAVALSILFGCVSSEGLQLISVNVKSVNASEGMEVSFACQTSFSQADVTLDPIIMRPPNTMLQEQTNSLFDLPDGGHELNISFIATAAINETKIICQATNTASGHIETGAPALLLVQGPPASVGDLHVEYEDVCCALVAWDAPYTLSGVPITGYNITVNNTSTNPDNGTLGTTLYLTGPGSYTVKVTPLIDAIPGDTVGIVVDIPEIRFNLTVRQMLKNLEFLLEITGKCCNAAPMDATLTLSDSSSTIVTFPPFVISENYSNQIVISIELEEYLLDRTLQSFMLVTYTNGRMIPTVARNFSTYSFDLLSANYSIVSEHGVCVECELMPASTQQAQGCHVELECDNGDHIEQDFFISGLTSASGCLPVAPSTPTLCTLLFYDIEEDGSVSSIPALTLDDVLVSGIMLATTSSIYTMGMVTTSPPTETGFSTTVIVTVVVVVVVVVLVLLIAVVVGVYCYKTVKRRSKTRHQPNMYQLSELPEAHAQNPLVPSLQYADVVTPEAGSVVVLPVEMNPVSYSSVNFEQLGVTSVDVMMDHKQLMCFVAPRVSSKWYDVGVALALTPPFLEDIEQNNGGSHERCISDVFQAWREQRTRPYTWESLLIALRAVGVREMEFASELELQIESLKQQQHQQQTMTASSLQPPLEGYSRLQHNSNRSTPCVTPSRHMPNTSFEGPTPTGSNAVSGTASIRLIQPGMTLDQLVGELGNRFASKWREAGTTLALTPPTLESIASRNCQEPTMCMTGVIQLWKHQQSRPYSLHTLITILKSIGEHEYARELENYQISSTT